MAKSCKEKPLSSVSPLGAKGPPFVSPWKRTEAGDPTRRPRIIEGVDVRDLRRWAQFSAHRRR